MKRNVYNFKSNIIPKIYMYNRDSYEITKIKDDYIIKEFKIYTDKNKNIKKVVITNGKHINCNPLNGEFCIPDYIKNIKLNKKNLSLLEMIFSVFNHNSSYYIPWNDFEYDISKNNIIEKIV